MGQKHSWNNPVRDLELSNKTERSKLLFILLPIIIGSVIFSFIISGNHMPERRRFPEENAVSELSVLVQGEVSYQQNHGRYGTLEELIISEEIGKGWLKPIRHGYLYSIQSANDKLVITTRPLEYDRDHRHSFYVDSQSNFVIRYKDKQGFDATFDDPILNEESINSAEK